MRVVRFVEGSLAVLRCSLSLRVRFNLLPPSAGRGDRREFWEPMTLQGPTLRLPQRRPISIVPFDALVYNNENRMPGATGPHTTGHYTNLGMVSWSLQQVRVKCSLALPVALTTACAHCRSGVGIAFFKHCCGLHCSADPLTGREMLQGDWRLACMLVQCQARKRPCQVLTEADASCQEQADFIVSLQMGIQQLTGAIWMCSDTKTTLCSSAREMCRPLTAVIEPLNRRIIPKLCTMPILMNVWSLN